jgi:hypothetical protein
MHESLAITEADALGLAEIAEVQLRLARRFAERAEAEDDIDRACKLARASERAARGYRQSLLLKARLGREATQAGEAVARAPRPRSPQEQARITRRAREIYEAVESHIYAEREAERLDDSDWRLNVLFRQIEELALETEGFADGDMDAQVAQVCGRLRVRPPPLRAGPGGAGRLAANGSPPPNSS